MGWGTMPRAPNPGTPADGKPAMQERAEQFRKNAEECNHLAVHLENREHIALPVEFAAAWLTQAQGV
jgi:hypothetical protein